MHYMQRTQIYLPKNQIDSLRKEAHRRKTAVSEVIREILAEKLEKRRLPAETSRERLIDAAKRINRLGLKAPRDLALNLDAYLYGRK